MRESLVSILKNNFVYRSLRKKLYEEPLSAYRAEILDCGRTNEVIFDAIHSGRPFMVSRLGSNELSVLHHNLRGQYPERLKSAMRECAGFFPATDSSLDEFSELYLESISEIDLLGVWFNPHESSVANNVCPKANLTRLRNLEPYFSDSPWSASLEGKTVLVVHPFSESIEKQYANRELLFKNKVLPEFTLKTFKAIQTAGGSCCIYSTWFDALRSMCRDIEQIEFDVAIVGAGAYGLPLSAHIKKMGKGAIHLGGATQLLFGIYGARWESKPEFKQLINDYWVRPSRGERPKSPGRIENACYW